MRANQKACEQKKNNDIILTIGMIVKNEEKVLERCLKSLKPLMDEVSSELIIADTGSVDGTFEIACRYTKNVFHFEWTGDFSEARNSTLEKASGKWYMYIDADEYLDKDISEITNFFNKSGLLSTLEGADIVLRSYFDDSKNEYSDLHLHRFKKIQGAVKPIRFVGKIHETIPMEYPIAHFSTILHHTGYCYSSVSQKEEKKERNYNIMRKEYEKKPDDLRILCHLIAGSDNESEREIYIKDALKIINNNKNDLYVRSVMVLAIDYYSCRNPEYALKISDDYFKNIDNYSVHLSTLNIYYIRAQIYTNLGKYADAIEEYKKYFGKYEEYRRNKLNCVDLGLCVISRINESDYNYAMNHYINSLIKERQYDLAYDVMNNIDCKKLSVDDYKGYLYVLRELYKNNKDYKSLSIYYEKICDICYDSNEKKALALYMIESIYYSFYIEKERLDFAKDVVLSGTKNKFTDFMKLILSENECGFEDNLYTFLNTTESLEDSYRDAIYLAIKHNVDISEIVFKIKVESYNSIISDIAVIHDDFSKLILNYHIYDGFSSKIQTMRWILCTYEMAVRRAFDLNKKEKYELYQRFVVILSDYVINVYNPELLNDDDIDVLPALHRFGYHMYNANFALNSGDKIGYIRNMKKALLSCESMKDVVEFLLEEFKKNL